LSDLQYSALSEFCEFGVGGACSGDLEISFWGGGLGCHWLNFLYLDMHSMGSSENVRVTVALIFFYLVFCSSSSRLGVAAGSVCSIFFMLIRRQRNPLPLLSLTGRSNFLLCS
jgi:hypothetical protein